MELKRQNEEGVSPVIGVILMVAITVILAAIIGAFVMGMAGNISKNHQVGFIAHRLNATAVQITNIGGQDVASLTGVDVLTTPAGTQLIPATGLTVGSSILMGVTSPASVTVTGTFSDGSKQVLLMLSAV